MGSLKRFNLKRLIKTFNADFFFETGTWKGDGLAYAASFPFKKLYSSEVVEEFAKKAKERFQDNNRVEIINLNSIDAFKEKLNRIDGNCIFWLDAHYPGADEGVTDYNDEVNEFIRLPLENEVELIALRQGKFKDVLLIDDLRIYEDGPYTYGNISSNIIPPKNRNIEFLYRLFSKTHDILRSYKDEGYVYLIPKDNKSHGWLSPLHKLSCLINKQII